MPSIEFANLVFRGARFDGALMPVEVLSELAAYRDLVLAVAKVLYQQANPDRQRLPKGFDANFQLVLNGVGEGSAVPQLSRLLPEGTLGLPFTHDVFEEARDLVETGIDAATRGNDLPEVIREVLPRFSEFGRTLRPDERIIVAKPNTRDGATYDRNIRAKLLRLTMSSYEDDVDLLGVVREADKDNDGFRLMTLDGLRVEVRPSPAFLPVAVKALEHSTVVRIRGTGLFDATGALQRVTSASDVSPAEEGADETTTRSGCPTPIEQQMESLAALPDGWYDEESARYDSEQLAWLTKLLNGVVKAFELPTPYVYPAPEGYARAEWSSAAAEIVVNVDLAEQTAEVIAAHVGSGVSFSETILHLSEAGSESLFGRFIVDNLASVTN